MLATFSTQFAQRHLPRLFLFALCLWAGVAKGQLGVTVTTTGTATSGGMAGSYANLAAAITALNASSAFTGTGTVVLTCTSGTSETTVAGGIQITKQATASVPVIIDGGGRTVSAPNPQTTNGLVDAVIKLVGADYVTIQNFTLTEHASNTTVALATNNMTEFGIALFYSGVVGSADGAQNNTIKSCTIDLNRNYPNSIGIYSNSSHTAAICTTLAAPTTANGMNSGLTIVGNIITDVNMGVAVIGPNNNPYHIDGVTIGGSAVNANSITNFGTSGTYSAFANLTTQGVNGVYIKNAKNVVVSYNTITSTNGGLITPSGVSLRGVFFPSFSAAPAGTIVNSINNNTISLRAGLTTGILQGVAIQTTTVNSTTTVNINNNDFNTFGHTSGTASGAITFISNVGVSLNQNINSNTFTNMSVTTTGSVIFIENNFIRPAGAVNNVNNNSIVTGFTKSGAGGTVTFYTTASNSPASVSETNTGNNFSNVNLTGATALGGWISSDGGSLNHPTKNVSNNTFSNITAGTQTSTALTVNFGVTTVSNNTISGLASPGVGGSILTPLSVGGAGATHNVYGNKIYDISSTSTSTAQILGISASNGTVVNIHNNIVGNITMPTASNADAIRGISLTGGSANSTVNLYYNTVYFNASTSGTNLGTAGVYHQFNTTATTNTLNMRNNIVVNTSTPKGTGRTAAFRRSASTNLNNYGTASNNNLLYAGTPGTNNVIFFDATNADQTLAAFQFRVGPTRDAASVTEMPTFLSTTGSDANFLHLDGSVLSLAESGAVNIATYTTDFDGNTRQGNPGYVGSGTAPDIGADEFATSLAPHDAAITAIISTPCPGVASQVQAVVKNFGSNTLTSVNIDWSVNSVAQTPANLTGLNVTTGNSTTVTIGSVTLPGGASANTIVAATASPNGNTDGNTSNDSHTNNAIYTALTGSYNVGTGGDFTTLTAAVTRYNLVGVCGAVTFLLTNSTYSTSETFPITINSVPGASSTNTLTIKPTISTTTIEGAVATSVIILNGADYVTIDGSIGANSYLACPASSESRDLIVRNTRTSAAGAVIWLQSTGSDGATNNTIKNCYVMGYSASFTSIGIGMGVSGTINTSSLGNGNNNNSIINNDVRAVFCGIYTSGASAGNKNQNNVINQNSMITSNVASINTSGAGIGMGAIYAGFENNITISGNVIDGVYNSTAGNDVFGIGLGVIPSGTLPAFSASVYTGNEVTNATITKNIIAYVGNYPNTNSASAGIIVVTASSGTTLIANNMVSGVAGAGNTASITAGIFVGGGAATTNIYHNTVNMSSSFYLAGANTPLYALAVGGTNSNIVNIQNNILSTNMTGTTQNYWLGCIGFAYTPNANLTSNNNNLYVNGANLAIAQTGALGITGYTSHVTLANWQTNTGKDLASKNIAPDFYSKYDLHLNPASALNIANLASTGAVISVTDDFDCSARDGSPDIGFDEFSSTAPVCIKTDFISPANGINNAVTGMQLTWLGALGATSYDVYFGTSSNPGFLGNTTTTSIDPGCLEPNTTYYWKVDPKNANGTTAACNEWTFTTSGTIGIYTENFSGFSEGAFSDVTPVGGWLTSTTLNQSGSDKNIWSCHGDASGNSVTNTYSAIAGNSIGISAYSSGAPTITGEFNYFNDLASTRWAYRPVSTVGLQNIKVSFRYNVGGEFDGSTAWDYGQFITSINGGANWANPATGGSDGAGKYYLQNGLNSATISLPATRDNNPNFVIGFHWTCDDNSGDGPTFVVDDIVVSGCPLPGDIAPLTSSVASGGSAVLTLTGVPTCAKFQWEQGATSSGPWSNVTGGSGATTNVYTTDALTATTYFRAKVYYGTCADVYQTTPAVVNIAGCAAPVSSAATGITSADAVANWTCSGCTGSFIIEYGATGFTPGTGATANGGTVITSGTGTTSIGITGLAQGTTYQYYVRQDCSGTISGNSSAQSFTTPCGATPASSAVTAIGTTTATVNWTCASCTGPGDFIIEYGTTGFTPGTGTTAGGGTVVTSASGTTSRGLTGLTPGVTYDVYVRHNCNGTVCSANSAVQTFTTNCGVPTSSAVTTITASGGTANWTCSGCTGTYVVEYGITGFTPGTGASAGTGGTVLTSGAGTTNRAITGLLPNTTYDVYVRQACASGVYSANSGVQTFTTLTLTLTTGTINPLEYCQGAAVSVPYTIGGTGTYGAGNTFTAQLSDATGSFASPVNIGSVTQTTAGTISATIPAAQPAGTGYRIRVVSSNPVVTGTNNGTDIIISVPLTVANTALPPTNITTNSFDANWTTSGGATSYVLEVSLYPTFSIATPATDLFISEYVEGSGNNKYIEIYNGTGATVNLSDYQLVLYQNGGSSPFATLTLSGTLADGSTIVYKNSSASAYAGTAISNSTVMIFNGDDAIALYKISSASNVDIIGSIGHDPGTAWTTGSHSTAEKTLVRKAAIGTGLTTNPATSFPTLTTEWDVFNQDVVSNLGSHTYNSSTPSFVLGYDPMVVTGGTTSSATVSGLASGTTYYYRLRSANACGECTNSNVMSATTQSSPTLSGSALTAFGTICVNSSVVNTFTLTGSTLTSADVIVGPLAGFRFSTTGNPGTFQNSLTITQGGGSLSQTIHVEFNPIAAISYGGTGSSGIPLSGGGASTAYVDATGTGTNPPAQPSSISGNATPCSSASGLTYSVTNVASVSYAWSFPSGWTGLTGQGTNSVTITAPASGTGDVTVTPSIGTCPGTPRTLTLAVTATPAQPSTISGPSTTCASLTGNVYSVTNVAGVTYAWSVSGTGWSIPTPSTTNSVTVTSGSGTGGITVTPSVNGCNGTARSLTGIAVTGSYVPTVSIAANTSYVCAGESYTFTATRTDGGGGTDSYVWKINGVQVSTTNPYTVAANTLVYGDAVTAELTVSGSCASPATVSSNIINVQKLAHTPTQVWNETLGTGTGTILSYSGYTNGAGLVITATSPGASMPDVRNTSASPMGGSNIFFPTTGTAGGPTSVIFSNINTTNAFPNRLSFYAGSGSSGTYDPTDFVVEYSVDNGATYHSLTYPAFNIPTNNAWTSSAVVVNEQLPISANLKLRFTTMSAAMRLDEIKLEKYTVADASITPSVTPVFCTQGTLTLNSAPTAASGLTYAWSPATFLNSTNTSNPTATNVNASTTYNVTVTDIFGCESEASQAIAVHANNLWTSNAGTTDWFTDGNWTCGIPTATTDAVIPANPSGGARFPEVTHGTLDAAVRDLTIQAGASLNITYTVTGGVPDGELAVHGTFTNASSTPVIGSGFLTMKAGSSIAGTVTVDYLKIDGNTSLAAGAAVNVRNELALFSGNLNTTNGTLTLKSTPTKTAYVNDFDFSTAGPYGTLTGNLTLERHIPATSGGNIFHYIGAVSSGTAGSKWTDDFNMAVTGTNGFITPSSCDPANPRTANTSNYGGLFTYHESNVTDCYLKGWKVENSSYTVAPGRGVAARINNNVVIEETGAYSAANTTVTNLSKTATNTTATSKGYNLVSNPFYAPISWSQVAADNLATWDGAAYVYNSSSGTYAVSNFLTSHLVINTNQAFFIRAGNSAANASNHTFVFNANTRTKGTNGIFYRQQQGYEYGLDITVQSANGKTDKTLVAFDGRFNDVFDNGYDAMKLFNDVGIPSVYTKAGDEQQAIQALPLISASSVTRSVPLSVLITTSGAHSFTFDGVADFPQTSIIWLEDLKTGTIQYLRQNNTYSFTANVGDDKDRFVIHFAPELRIATTMADCSGNNGEIAFEQRGGIEWAFRLKDANGAVVASDLFNATRMLNQLAPGTYTLSLTHPVSGYATTMTIEVNGLQPVTAAISAPVTEVFAGEAFTVDAQTTGSTTYTWQMGDHTSYIDLSSVTYAYRLPGMYEITLTASNNGCSAQSTVRIIVNKRPEDVDTVSTGIPGVEAGNITIYESEDVLYISQSVTRQLADANVILYNNLGQVVLAEKLSGMAFGAKHTIPVNTAAGVYYVSVELADGHSALQKVMLGKTR